METSTKSVGKHGHKDAINMILSGDDDGTGTENVDTLDISPGPTSYQLPDTIGRQPLSTFRNPSTLPFGYSKRDSVEIRDDLPGPGAYYRETRLGESNVSTIRRATDFSLGGSETATRPNVDPSAPGPGQYGRDYNDPKYTNAPKHSMMDKRPVDPALAKKGIPPPGAYKSFETVSCKVPLSTIKNSSTVSFGLGKREEKAGDSQISAAPGDYKIMHSLGKQHESTRKTAPSSEIRGKREYKQKPSSTRTGPGYYKVQTGMGKQLASAKKTGPSFSMSGRTTFGSYM